MTPFHALLALFAAGFAGMVAVFHRYYYKPEQEEPITSIPMPEPVQTPEIAPQSEYEAPHVDSALDIFCGAIKDFEGKPGDLNYKNNNPGNTRCSAVGYLPKYGNVKCVNNFAVFPTWNLGWEYLQALVHYRATEHPNWTILDFFINYAPSSDRNNPAHYAATVAGKCGVLVTCTLKELFA